jgi:hypothetical protein
MSLGNVMTKAYPGRGEASCAFSALRTSDGPTDPRKS